MGIRVTVKFIKSYVASRGAGISGRKGQTRTFATSDDLDALIKNGICEKVKDAFEPKKTVAKKRTKATRETREMR